MNRYDRARNLLLKPRTEWQAIDRETAPAMDLTRAWLLPLAALAAVATGLGMLIWGAGFGPVSIRFGIGDAVGAMLLSLIAMIVAAWVLAGVVNALAPVFGGARSFDRAFALSAYAMVGSLVGSMASILPGILSFPLGIAGFVWSLVLLYLGLPVMMKTPASRALPYTVLAVVGAIICQLLIHAVLRLVVPGAQQPGSQAMSGDTTVSVQTPAGPVSATSQQIQEAARGLEQAARNAESANARQDPQALGRAATEAMAAITGAAPGGSREPVSTDAMKARMPESVGSFRRATFEVQSGNVLGIAGTTASARYRDGDRRIAVEVMDAGGASGMLAMIGSLQAGERETDVLAERSYQKDGRRITEKRWKREARSELMMILANGVMFSAKGEGVDLDALRAFVAATGLEQLENESAPVSAAAQRQQSGRQQSGRQETGR